MVTCEGPKQYFRYKGQWIKLSLTLLSNGLFWKENQIHHSLTLTQKPYAVAGRILKECMIFPSLIPLHFCLKKF